VGTRGPAPKPTSLVLLEGNIGKRSLNRREPKPRSSRPKCPSHLDEAAVKEWKRLVPILSRMRVLTEADGMALSNLCQAFSTMVKAQEQLHKSGVLYKTKSGYIQQSPLLGIVNSQVDIVNRLCREFGLTPSSRTRIQSGEGEPASHLDSYLD
jgi:P27 family predicted phage terminase small subunit